MGKAMRCNKLHIKRSAPQSQELSDRVAAPPIQYMHVTSIVLVEETPVDGGSACHLPTRLPPRKTSTNMKFLILSTLFATATSSVTGQVCSENDVASIRTWMAACDSITTGSAAKCANRACHNALHRLLEEETHECWEQNGGSHKDFEKYEALDLFCHGEGPDPDLPVDPSSPPSNSTAAPGPLCNIEDGLEIFGWMYACDSVQGDSAAKCADSGCHEALHHLEEEETHECWEHLGLGTHEDFDKYLELDAACHGERA